MTFPDTRPKLLSMLHRTDSTEVRMQIIAKLAKLQREGRK